MAEMRNCSPRTTPHYISLIPYYYLLFCPYFLFPRNSGCLAAAAAFFLFLLFVTTYEVRESRGTYLVCQYRRICTNACKHVIIKLCAEPITPFIASRGCAGQFSHHFSGGAGNLFILFLCVFCFSFPLFDPLAHVRSAYITSNQWRLKGDVWEQNDFQRVCE